MSGQLMLINPAKRKRTNAQKAATKRMVAANKAKRRKPATTAKKAIHRMKRRAKNPIQGKFGAMIAPAFVGGLGAVAINTVQHQVVSRFIPNAALQNSKVVKYGTRAALAVVLGMAGGKLIGGARARQAAEGALTVLVHDVTVETVNGFLGTAGKPASVLAAYSENAPALEDRSMSAYVEPGMGAYVEPGMGEYAEEAYVMD